MARINLRSRLLKEGRLRDQGIYRGRPHRSLVSGRKRAVGRSLGRITVRHRGGGVKRLIRRVELTRGVFTGQVERIEYDPNRSSYLALLRCDDGRPRYILAAAGLKAGDTVAWGERVEPRVGCRMNLEYIPVGTMVHNIEFQPGSLAGIARAAGSFAEYLSLEEGVATLKLPSGEIRRVDGRSLASIGQLSRIHHQLERIGKAGRRRLRGIRPTVRGAAQSPYAHPHGGGEGKAGIGMPAPKTPWGKIARGVKTRKPKKYSDRLIVQRRK